MSNPFSLIFSAIGHFFLSFFTALFGADLAHSLASSLESLAKDSVGKLAIDAVQWVEAELPGTTDATAKRDAAVAKLKEDLATAGHSLETFGLSVLNMLVELAVQYVKKYLPSAAPAQAAVATDPALPTAG